MANILNYSPGQLATIFLELKDANGVRTDDGYVPVVTQVIMPSLNVSSGFPQNMSELSPGLYYFQFTIPPGAAAVGSYLIDVVYLNPANGYMNNEIFQIVVNAAYGNFGVTTF